MSLALLVHSLLKQAHETEWLEFKQHNGNERQIGEYISALSNAAALVGQRCGYVVWGVEDGTRQLLGTHFDPATAKIGNEPLESWLARLLTPRLDFRFDAGEVDGKPVVVLEVPAARQMPTRFEGAEFLRVGSVKKNLKDHPEKERALWELFRQTPFEFDVAMADVDAARVLELLDYPAYFSLTNQPLPEGREGIMASLTAERFVQMRVNGRFDIANLGALLVAKDLAQFARLGRAVMQWVMPVRSNT